MGVLLEVSFPPSNTYVVFCWGEIFPSAEFAMRRRMGDEAAGEKFNQHVFSLAGRQKEIIGGENVCRGSVKAKRVIEFCHLVSFALRVELI